MGGLGVWKICPLFKGVGYAAAIMAFWLNSYYIVVLAWGLYYLWLSIPRSLDYELPWSTCKNTWNTPKCIDSKFFTNTTKLNDSISSTEEFWV